MSSNKTMKNKLVNSMRATKAGTSKAVDVEPTEKQAPVAQQAATPAKQAKPGKKPAVSQPASTGFSSSCRVWPD